MNIFWKIKTTTATKTKESRLFGDTCYPSKRNGLEPEKIAASVNSRTMIQKLYCTSGISAEPKGRVST